MVDAWESTGLREGNFAEKPCRILNTLEFGAPRVLGIPWALSLATGIWGDASPNLVNRSFPIWISKVQCTHVSHVSHVHLYQLCHLCLKTNWHTNTCDKMCTSLEISPLASVTLLSLEVQIAQVVQVARCKGWAVGAMGCNFLGKVQ